MDWKYGKKDEYLFNNDKEIVRDAYGRQNLNNGDWDNPTSKDQFLTTTTKLHTMCDQSGNYSYPCDSCFDNYFTKGTKIGCMHHVGAPRTLHSGNPRSSAIVKSAVKKYQHPYCLPNSDSALSPVEVKNVHDKLLPRLCTNVHNLQIWLIMLVQIKLCLRGDEIIKLRYEDVVGELSVFNINGSFECMPLDALGKEEKEAHTTLAT